MRVVFDTNILISAFIFPGGPPEAAFRLALEGHVELVTSRALLAELGRVLVDKFDWTNARAEQAVAQVIRVGTLVDPTESVRVVQADPDDDRVLEAALEGKVDVIVTGDSHLLRIRSWRGTRIEAASVLLAELE